MEGEREREGRKRKQRGLIHSRVDLKTHVVNFSSMSF